MAPVAQGAPPNFFFVFRRYGDPAGRGETDNCAVAMLSRKIVTFSGWIHLIDAGSAR
jgi:hypothetical protein